MAEKPSFTESAGRFVGGIRKWATEWYEEFKGAQEDAIGKDTRQQLDAAKKAQAQVPSAQPTTTPPVAPKPEPAVANAPAAAPKLVSPESSTEQVGKARVALTEIKKVLEKTTGAGDYVKQADEMLAKIAGYDDKKLQSDDELKKTYASVIDGMNGFVAKAALGDGLGVMTTQLEIIRTAIYTPEQASSAPSIAAAATGDSAVEAKVGKFFTETLGMDKEGMGFKAIMGILGAIGLFKAGSFLSKAFDWIADPLEKAREEFLPTWAAHPIDWSTAKAKEYWGRTRKWVAGWFGKGIPLGDITSNGKGYKNDKLSVAGDTTVITLNGTKYNIFTGSNKSTISYEKWDKTDGDYVVINGEKVPVELLFEKAKAVDFKEKVEVATNFGNSKELLSLQKA